VGNAQHDDEHGDLFRPIDPAELGIEQPRVTIDTSVAHPARIYDYLLGGKDNFNADRQAARKVLDAIPMVQEEARANREFLHRAVAHTAQQGVEQFLDIGTGIPTAGPTHQVAQSIVPGARIVYVDNDPIVLAHARALLATDDRTIALQADVRDPDAVLTQARGLLDFTRPIGLMFIGLWYFIPDEDDPHGLAAIYRDAMAPGSHMLATHILDAPQIRQAARAYAEASAPLVGRSPHAITELFGDWPLADPGLVPVHRWRPTGGETRSDFVTGGLAVKP